MASGSETIFPSASPRRTVTCSSTPAVQVNFSGNLRRSSEVVLSTRRPTIPNAGASSGTSSLSRVRPRRTRSGARATTFIESGVSVSARSAGARSNESISAPESTARTRRSTASRRSLGVRRRNMWRNATSFMPVNSKDDSTSAVPSSASVAVVAMRAAFSCHGLTGERRRSSPSGVATRYEQSARYDGNRSRADSSVGSMRTNGSAAPSPAATATIAWLKYGSGTSGSILPPAWIRTGYAGRPAMRSMAARSAALSRHTPYRLSKVSDTSCGAYPGDSSSSVRPM